MLLLTAVSIWVSWSAYAASREATDIMREQIKASSRPYVVVELLDDGKEVYISVKNTGTSSAHEVTVNSKHLLRYETDDGSGPLRLFKTPITFLAPGANLKELLMRPGYEARFELNVHYHDDQGTKYNEACTLTVRRDED